MTLEELSREAQNNPYLSIDPFLFINTQQAHMQLLNIDSLDEGGVALDERIIQTPTSRHHRLRTEYLRVIDHETRALHELTHTHGEDNKPGILNTMRRYGTTLLPGVRSLDARTRYIELDITVNHHAAASYLEQTAKNTAETLTLRHALHQGLAQDFAAGAQELKKAAAKAYAAVHKGIKYHNHKTPASYDELQELAQ